MFCLVVSCLCHTTHWHTHTHIHQATTPGSPLAQTTLVDTSYAASLTAANVTLFRCADGSGTHACGGSTAKREARQNVVIDDGEYIFQSQSSWVESPLHIILCAHFDLFCKTIIRTYTHAVQSVAAQCCVGGMKLDAYSGSCQVVCEYWLICVKMLSTHELQSDPSSFCKHLSSFRVFEIPRYLIVFVFQ
jgi:hypothetical protein